MLSQIWTLEIDTTSILEACLVQVVDVVVLVESVVSLVLAFEDLCENTFWLVEVLVLDSSAVNTIKLILHVAWRSLTL